MTQTVAIELLMFLLGQIILLTVTQVAGDHSILATTVVTENDAEISLRWVETEPLLANENLPIWLTATLPEYVERDLNVMKEIGKFRTYYDLDKSSAIVLFEKWDCIYGTIDVRYYIACLPLSQLLDHKHKIGQSETLILMNSEGLYNHKRYLSPTSLANGAGMSTFDDDTNDFNMLIETLVNDVSLMSHQRECAQRKTVIQSTSSYEHPSPNKQRRTDYYYEKQVITVYPEILIFISNDIVRTAKHLATIVLRYIVQFNAVAMLFAKLATHNIKIHINIAGLVIEKKRLQFPFTPLFEDGRPSGDSVLNSIIEYIKNVEMISNTKGHQSKLFTDDSFDMFLLSTTNKWQELEKNLGGMSTSVFDITKNRKHRLSIDKKKFMGSLVDGMNVVQHYVNAAREIAHLMTVQDDPPSESDWCSNGDQYHAIMQSNEHCPNCLKWSRKSVNSFKKYLSTNSNRCFLRNLPRSLHPYGIPIKTLVPADQCLCYGHNPDTEITHLDHSTGSCRQALRCIGQRNGMRPRGTPIPVDGTPCNEIDKSKVCWNEICISTQLRTN